MTFYYVKNFADGIAYPQEAFDWISSQGQNI